MKSLILSICIIIFSISLLNGQNNRAVMELDATDKGFLIPRLTGDQKDTLSTKLSAMHLGMLIFNKEKNEFCFWDSTSWQPIGPSLWSSNSNGLLFNRFGGQVAVGADTAELLDFFTVAGTSYFHDEIQLGKFKMVSVKEVEKFLGLDSTRHAGVISLNQLEVNPGFTLHDNTPVIELRARADSDLSVEMRNSDDHNPSMITRNGLKTIGHEWSYHEEHPQSELYDANGTKRVSIRSRDTLNLWPEITLYEVEGQPTLQIIGEENGAGAVRIKSQSSQDRIALRGKDNLDYGGSVEIMNSLNTQTLKLDGEAFGDGGALFLFDGSGDLRATLSSNSLGLNDSGGELILLDENGAPSIRLDGNYDGTSHGRVITQELEITGGSDLSEFFNIEERSGNEIKEGSLVCIDEKNAGKLKICDESYDKKVAGVVSGANGIKPGLMMGQKESIADGKWAVSLHGRVYVRASTINGPIKPGDELTTSSIPGIAMKATRKRRKQGAVIGKAMTSLQRSNGFVLVLLK